MIIRDPEILGGTPVIKGTRIPVELMIEYFSHGFSVEEIQDDYPYLTKDEIIECLNYSPICKEEDKPYNQEDYEKAKEQGLDLDDWNDYVRFYGLGEEEEEY